MVRQTAREIEDGQTDGSVAVKLRDPASVSSNNRRTGTVHQIFFRKESNRFKSLAVKRYIAHSFLSSPISLPLQYATASDCFLFPFVHLRRPLELTTRKTRARTHRHPHTQHKHFRCCLSDLDLRRRTKSKESKQTWGLVLFVITCDTAG